MFGEDLPAVLVALDLPHGFANPGQLQSEFKTSDSGEERAYLHSAHFLHPMQHAAMTNVQHASVA